MTTKKPTLTMSFDKQDVDLKKKRCERKNKFEKGVEPEKTVRAPTLAESGKRLASGAATVTLGQAERFAGHEGTSAIAGARQGAAIGRHAFSPVLGDKPKVKEPKMEKGYTNPRSGKKYSVSPKKAAGFSQMAHQWSSNAKSANTGDNHATAAKQHLAAAFYQHHAGDSAKAKTHLAAVGTHVSQAKKLGVGSSGKRALAWVDKNHGSTKALVSGSVKKAVDVDIDAGVYGVANYNGEVAMRVKPNTKCNGCLHYDQGQTACRIGVVPSVCGDGSFPEIGYAPSVPTHEAAAHHRQLHSDAVAMPAQAEAHPVIAEVPYRIEVLGDSALSLSERMTLVKSAYRVAQETLEPGQDLRLLVEEMTGETLFEPVEDDVLMKGAKKGAGSRGGKVIGHTRSGKPIYAPSHQLRAVKRLNRLVRPSMRDEQDALSEASDRQLDQHPGFSVEDHQDAEKLHNQKWEEHMEGNPDLSEAHRLAAETHGEDQGQYYARKEEEKKQRRADERPQKLKTRGNSKVSKSVIDDFADAMGTTVDVVSDIARRLGSRKDFAEFIKSKLPDIMMAHGLDEASVGQLYRSALRMVKSLSDHQWEAWKGFSFSENVSDAELANAIQRNGGLLDNNVVHGAITAREPSSNLPPPEPIQAPAQVTVPMGGFVGGNLHLADIINKVR
jgi:hypothetical protein